MENRLDSVTRYVAARGKNRRRNSLSGRVLVLYYRLNGEISEEKDKAEVEGKGIGCTTLFMGYTVGVLV